MRIKRKIFSNPNPPSQNLIQPGNPQQLTSRDIQLEQMKLQRQLMITQRTKQKLQAEERRSEMNRIIQQQRMEQRKNTEEDKQRIRVKRMEDQNNSVVNNTPLYKTKSRPVSPVPM